MSHQHIYYNLIKITVLLFNLNKKNLLKTDKIIKTGYFTYFCSPSIIRKLYCIENITMNIV